MMLQSSKPMYSATFAFNCLRKLLSEEAIDPVKGMSLTVDNLGAVFDVPSELVNEFLAAGASGYALRERLSITTLDTLPQLIARPDRHMQGRGGGFGGRGGGRGGNFGMNGPGRGAYSSSAPWHGRGSAGGSGFGNTSTPNSGRGGGFGNSNMNGPGRGGGFSNFNTSGPNNFSSGGSWRGGRGGGGRGQSRW